MKPLYRPPLETSALIVKTGHQKQSAEPASHGTPSEWVNGSPTHTQALSLQIHQISSLSCEQSSGMTTETAITAICPVDQFLERDAHAYSALYCYNQSTQMHRNLSFQQSLSLQRMQTRELNWECATALVLKLYHGQFNWKACVYPGVLSSLQMLSHLTSFVQGSTPRKSPEDSAGKLRFPILILLMDSMSCPIC